MTEKEAKNKKYVIIDKTNGFGYASSKYADMFNMTMPEHATVFENRKIAEQIALSINLNTGYKLQVFDYEEALLDIIKKQAEKVKQSADDNLTQNRMWSIIYSIEKLYKSFEEIQQYRAIGTVEEFKALKEKSEPKKPTQISKALDGTKYVGLIGKCPRCNSLVAEDNFVCEDCFQVLDWSE